MDYKKAYEAEHEEKLAYIEGRGQAPLRKYKLKMS